MKFFMFLGFLGHTLGCLPGFSRIFTNKFKDLTKKKNSLKAEREREREGERKTRRSGG